MENLQTLFPFLETHVALAPLTTFKIGGIAAYLHRVTEKEEFLAVLTYVRTHHIPYFFLGGGSCVLLSSAPFPGVVFLFKNNTISVDGTQITAQAGAAWNQVLLTAYKHGLTGMEEMVGIPGTVGGAVIGNVGIPDHEVRHVLTHCTVITQSGAIEQRTNDACAFAYRSSRMKKENEILWDATFTLSPGEPKAMMELLTRYRKQRAQKHPHDPSAGSYFKNPFPDKPAGLLLDQIGAKGMCVGDACVSEKHANFLINKGQATSQDMLALAEKLKTQVQQHFGILLQEEVRYIDLSTL